jgi:2-desacetyl-2-hydroxyethyl bacteriochlorophyllide A dehydrogenase
MKTKGIIFTSPFQVEIGSYELRDLNDGEILTKTIFTGISPGTELRVFSGKQYGANFPLIPGYENVGEVIKGKNVNLKEGIKVFLSGTLYTGPYQRVWGGHVEYAISKEEDVIVIPENLDPLHAVFTKTCAIALHGIKRAGVKKYDKVAIVGQGLIGHLALQIAKEKGAFVISIDTVEERLLSSKKAGADYIINAKERDVYKEVMDITNGGVDIAIDVTGVAKTVNSTANLIKPRPFILKSTDDPNPPIGKLLVLGSYTEPICFDYHPTLFDHEIDIIVSRDCTYFDMLEALDLIVNNKINFSAISYEIFNFKDAKIAYQKLIDKKIIKGIFSWE